MATKGIKKVVEKGKIFAGGEFSKPARQILLLKQKAAVTGWFFVGLTV